MSKRRASTEVDLVEQARRGSSDAFEQLYVQYLPSLYYFVRKRIGSEADAADIIQDTFINALVKFNELKDPAAFRPWLFRIALSRATDISRQGARYSSSIDFDNPSFDESAVLGDSVYTEAYFSPEAAHEQHETSSEMLRCLDQLTSMQKDVLILRYYVGFSTAAIAELLEVKQGAILKRLHDARTALYDLITRHPTTAMQLMKQTDATSEREVSEAFVGQLLREDGRVTTKNKKKLNEMVTVPMCSALAGMLTQGGLQPQAALRVQSFLSSMKTANAPASVKATGNIGRTSLMKSAWGKVLLAALGGTLVAALGFGSVALYSAGRKPEKDLSTLPAVSRRTRRAHDMNQQSKKESVITTQGPSVSASNDSAEGLPAPEPQITQTRASSAPEQPIVSSAQPTTQVSSSQRPTPAPPTLQIVTFDLHYSCGTVLTAAQLIADSGAQAWDARGTHLPIIVAGIKSIDTSKAGTWLVFLNATNDQGVSAGTQTLYVTMTSG